MTHKDRPKLPLLVLAAGGILLGAAALQSVLITVPGPSSSPHAISVGSGRPAGVPAPSPTPSSSPTAEPADPTTTGAVPDPPAGHAIDPARPASPPEPASVGAEHPADASPKDEPQSAAVPAPAAAEPEGGPDTGAPAKLESAGSETLTEPHEPAAEALKVETPPAESKPSPQALPSQLATTPEEAPHPAPAPPPPEIKAVAAAPKVETVPAQPKPVVEPEPTQVVKSETVEETPVPAQAPSSPKINQAAAEARSPKPGLTPAAESKPQAKPEPKAAPAEKPKETAAAEAQGAPTAKPMSLGFGRKPAPAAGKVSSGRYAANVRASIGRHRPGVRGGGSATVAFSIGPAGGLQGVQVVRSSGKPALDQAAIATVRSAAPFPPPPPGVKSTFSIQIYFR